MEENKKNFMNQLKSLMLYENKSRWDLSKDLKISYTTICDWVNGRVLPRSEKLNKLADYFGIPVSKFFENSNTSFIYSNDSEDKLYQAIKLYSKNNHQEELLTKSTMLNLDNTKKAIEQVDFLLYKQDKEENNFKFLDNLDDKNYDK